ncbi:hypothetical protein BAUCODRAFT_36939 [Baudoinia panamericana UAMH 10762]|uniref:Uncharacterized protein n=1 Tax=Baudoinia panamericana (strain UAMH 10762) TaxID=717646 RepID=M2LGP2_BAUPA|nr:uncharacterized protein BAUCODRAFT_36939 [Baudoinia panamericana UAMH 10762]EMC93267.1 hypothetical protein BAUCODRAFT_36939 [Baudoinia panamericana UAMH 10762]
MTIERSVCLRLSPGRHSLQVLASRLSRPGRTAAALISFLALDLRPHDQPHYTV